MPSTESQLRQLAATMLDLSGLRDRQALEQRLIAGLAEMLAPTSLSLLTRAEAGSSGPSWGTAHAWPTASGHLADLPETSDPVRTGLRDWVARIERPAQAVDQPGLQVFPLLHGHTPPALLEIEMPRGCDAGERLRVDQLLRLYGNLRRLLDDNECDELTGLLNRKTFDESFMRLGPLRHGQPASPLQEIGPAEPLSAAETDERRARPEVGESWLAVVDVDHFKRVNDRYGHLVGDEVLLLLSQLMRDTFRQEDRLYRFGGEEFVVLLRCPAATGARAALERLRRRVAERDFPQVGHLTISIGYTRIDADDTPESAFGRADQAVYHAKQAGRDQVHEHAELVALGLLKAPEPTPSGVDFF